ncbi:unnamed protein product, partial [Laminaria digitata]
QIYQLLESPKADPPSVLPAALLCRVQALLLHNTGATSARAFLVDSWFNKLFRFSPAANADHHVGAEAGAAGGGRVGGGERQRQWRQRRQQQEEAFFEARAVCEIGEGVAGMAAMTGKKLRVRGCCVGESQDRGQDRGHAHRGGGSVVCWPVRRLPGHGAGGGSSGGAAAAAAAASESESESESDDAALGPQQPAAVIAVLQVYFADIGVDDELSAEAVQVVHDVGRLLSPLLTDALDRGEDQVLRRSAEARLSLSEIVPRDIGLIAMVEQVVAVAQRLTEAERVCLFFVDDAAGELWVAKSVDFDDAKIKIGHGLCGHAAATGGTVNVIDSYEDSRFDSRWDKRTGFVTKSVLCVPIPPPEHATTGGGGGGGGGGRGGERGPRRMGSVAGGAGQQEQGSAGRGSPVGAWMSTPGSQTRLDQQQQQQQQQQGGGGQRAELVWRRVDEARARPQPQQQQHHHRPVRPKPMAVLEVMNKRGAGMFTEHEEKALLRLCASVETLLRRKAAEIALLWSGMTERSLIRKGRECRGGEGEGGGGGA